MKKIMLRKPIVLVEANCLYSFDRVEGWMHLAYRWRHLPTDKDGIHRAYFHGGREALFVLLAHWNRDPRWKYELL